MISTKDIVRLFVLKRKIFLQVPLKYVDFILYISNQLIILRESHLLTVILVC